MPSPHIAPAGRGPRGNRVIHMMKMQLHDCITVAQITAGPRPIPALACPGTPGLALRSRNGYGYSFRSSAESSRTCPVPSSGMPVQYAS
jgi:hypothetical protein